MWTTVSKYILGTIVCFKSFFFGDDLNATLGRKKMKYTLLVKRENNSAEKEGFFMLLFPFPLTRNNENGNIENRIEIGCAPCTMTLVFLPAVRKRLL